MNRTTFDYRVLATATDGTRVTSADGPAVTVPDDFWADYAAASPGATFVGDDAVGVLAGVLARVPARGPTATAVWGLLRANRVIDLKVGRELIELAEAGAAAVPPGDPAAILARLNALDPSPRTAYGPLGIGLSVGAGVALGLLGRCGIPVAAAGRAALVGAVERVRDDALHALANAPVAKAWLKPDLDNRGFPDTRGAEFEEWVEGLRTQIADARGVTWKPFLRPADGVGKLVEYWPLWARGGAGAARWARLMRLCKLARELRTLGGGVIKPKFAFVDGLRYRTFDFGPVGLDQLFRLAESSVRPVRVGLTGLRTAVLSAHLDRDHGTGPRAEPGFEEVLLATGLSWDGVAELAAWEFGRPVNKARLPARRQAVPALGAHLTDDSFARIERVLGFAGGVLRRAAPTATAVDLATAYEVNVTHSPPAVALRAALARTADGTRSVRGAVNGRGASAYRRHTNERITLGSGRVLGGLPWPAARTAEVHGEAAEAVKAVVYAVAASGHRVVGFEDEAVWVGGLRAPDPTVAGLVADTLRPFTGGHPPPLTWWSPPDEETG